VIRGQALGHLSGANFRWLFNRELLVAALNGVLWAIVIAILAWVWFGDPRLSLIMAAAIMINLMAAAVAGASLPQILKARGIDPALAGGVILTTVTDVVGFMSFLGLATLIYI
jgi:magnesium transporter